ncbi:hypothetical protein K439DRAFT_246098 [Ramaria rubella]|nr:hypothetical protein K439DRAFT_246098 [Ramaria rubella]
MSKSDPRAPTLYADKKSRYCPALDTVTFKFYISYFYLLVFFLESAVHMQACVSMRLLTRVQVLHPDSATKLQTPNPPFPPTSPHPAPRRLTPPHSNSRPPSPHTYTTSRSNR